MAPFQLSYVYINPNNLQPPLYIDPNPEEYDQTQKLTLVALDNDCELKLTFGDSTEQIKINRNKLSTVLYQDPWVNYNDGEDYTLGSTLLLNKGDTVSFWNKTKQPEYQEDQYSYPYIDLDKEIELPSRGVFHFQLTGRFDSYGKVYSLWWDNSPFNGDPWFLYAGLFKDCTTLRSAPNLFKSSDYHLNDNIKPCSFLKMFENCTNLQFIPSSSFTETTNQITDYAYFGVFYQMFKNCKSLNIPIFICDDTSDFHEKNQTRVQMFYGCEKINKITYDKSSWYLEDIPQIKTINKNWLYGVSPTGTFITNITPSTYFNSGDSGIPIGWTYDYKSNLN